MSVFIGSPSEEGVPVIGFTMRMVFPGQDVVRSRYSGQAQVVGRGPGHWAGSVTWLPATRAHVGVLSAFFACIEGEANHTRIPLPASRYAPLVAPPSGFRASAADTGTISSGAGTMTVSVRKDTAHNYTIMRGSMVNIGTRLYQVIVAHASVQGALGNETDMNVVPLAPVAVGASLSLAAPFVRARAAVSEQGLIGHTGHVNDPVVWDWEEAI